MKLTPQKHEEISSATLTQTLGLIVAFSGLVVVASSASPPAWWASPGTGSQSAVVAPQVTTNNGVVTTNYAPNPRAVITQGQLKQFTARAIDELNSALSQDGGAGPALTNVAYGWKQDYATNGYATNTANPTRPHKPSDLQMVTQGQLKYIAGLVYGRLSAVGYIELTPTWLHQNTNTDHQLSNLGQLKQVFNFDLSLPGPSNLKATPGAPGTINLSWTLPGTNNATSLLIEEQNPNGTWSVIATLTNPSATSYAVTGLTNGQRYAFQVIAVGANSVALPISASGTPWTSQDIGAVNSAGTYSYNSTTGVYTLKGNGADIFGTADAFHFVYQTISGDGELKARVTGIQNTNSWAKAGVMVRQSTAAGSIQAMTAVTPGNGLTFMYRTTTGGASNDDARVSTVVAPWWVKIVKDGNIVTSYQSSDGNSWTLLGYTQLTFTGPVDIGLVVCSHTNDSTLCTATFDNVSLVSQPNFAAPAPWLDQDIGSTGITGKVHYEASQWSMYASGADIWNNADAFHFAYQPLTGNGSIIAQVSALTNTNSWTKAGVMIRQDLTVGAANALVAVTPGNGVSFQYRTSAGGSSSFVAGARVTAPYWVKLTRSGNQFYAYQSSDGSTWQQIGVQTITMPSQVYIGLAETSHNNSALALGIFNHVQASP